MVLMSLVASLTTEFMMTAAPLSAKSATPTHLRPIQDVVGGGRRLIKAAGHRQDYAILIFVTF
jgi:hypothetical protein